jgi:hypothetical protein
VARRLLLPASELFSSWHAQGEERSPSISISLLSQYSTGQSIVGATPLSLSLAHTQGRSILAAACSAVFSQQMEDEIAPVENYSELEKVGQGAYGTVYKGKCNSTGDWVALKKVHLNAETEGVPSTALREISMLRELASHPCVVSLRDILYKSNNVRLHES